MLPHKLNNNKQDLRPLKRIKENKELLMVLNNKPKNKRNNNK